MVDLTTDFSYLCYRRKKYKVWWILWQDESLETGLTEPMAALMKRSKALRFYGLMGKRSGSLY